MTVKRSREERIKEILTAAKKVFSTKGYSGASMEDIIAETSLSKGGFYHYFSNKRAIFVAILNEGTDAAISKIKRYKKDVKTPDEFMENFKKDLLEDIFSYTEESKMYMTLISEIYLDKEFFDYMRSLYEKYFTILIEEIHKIFPQLSLEVLEKKIKLTCYTLFAVGFYSKILRLDDMYKDNMQFLEKIFEDELGTFIT